MSARRRYRLSPHFVLGEFRDKRTGSLPPARVDRALVVLCREALEPVRAAYGPVTIHSGYRSPRSNELVGGAERSHHVYIWWPGSPAADFTARHGRPRDWYRLLDGLGVGGLGLYDTHVHVDLRSGPLARW